MRNQKGIKIELQKKVHRRIGVNMWGTSLFWLHDLLSVSFVIAFFVYSVPLPKWSTGWMTPIKIYSIAWVVFCVIISWLSGQKYENLLQFNASLLAFLRTWYYFRPFFSFICFGNDFKLILKSHTLNYYWFLKKFLLKTKTCNLVIGKYGSWNYCLKDKFFTYVLFNK